MAESKEFKEWDTFKAQRDRDGCEEVIVIWRCLIQWRTRAGHHQGWGSGFIRTADGIEVEPSGDGTFAVPGLDREGDVWRPTTKLHPIVQKWLTNDAPA